MLGDMIGKNTYRISLVANSLEEILEQVEEIENKLRMACKISHVYAQGSRHYAIIQCPKKVVKKKVTKKTIKKEV